MTLVFLIIDTLLMGYAINLIQEQNKKDDLVLKGVEALVKDKEN